MGFLFMVRLLQAFRLLRGAGWGILVILVLVTAGIWAPVLMSLVDLTPQLAGGLGIFIAATLHLGRSDAQFIRQMRWPVWQICLLDTCLFLLPGAILFLVLGNWSAAAAFCTGLGVIALPAGGFAGQWTKKAGFPVPLIPVTLFEWRASIRRYLPFWVLAGLLQLGAFHHIAFFLVAIATGMLLLGAVFEFLEPKELVPPNRKALLSRWRQNALALHLFYAPGYVLALAGHPGQFWLILYAGAALETLLALSFFYKYSVWSPGLERVSGGVFTAIGMLLALVPGGLLIAIPMSIWISWKAVRRMAYFIYD